MLLHSFVGLIVKGIAIWGVRRPDVWSDVAAEIFSQPNLSSSTCVAWVLLSDVGYSSSSHLDLGQNYPLKALDVGQRVESEVMNQDITSPTLETTPNTIMGTGRKFSHLRKSRCMFWWKRCLSLLKNLTAWSFLLYFMVCDKKCPFLILMRNTACLHALSVW